MMLNRDTARAVEKLRVDAATELFDALGAWSARFPRSDDPAPESQRLFLAYQRLLRDTGLVYDQAREGGRR